MDFLHDTYTNRGIYTIDIDGTIIGTVDGYGAVSARLMTTITGIMLTAGAHVIRFLMATKNGASSAYNGALTAVVFTRTA
jgi:hypothetical protein